MRRREFMSALGLSAATAVLPGGAAGALVRQRSTGLPLVAARTADSLCESYLINTKIFYKDQVYGHTNAVIELLQELGVRTVRERITTGTSGGTRNQQYAMPILANAGIRWHATVGELEDWASATAVNKGVMDFLTSYYAPKLGGNLSAMMHSFGGCNEIDGPVVNGTRDPEWAAHARIMQRALWAQAKANPKTQGIPVAGPSTRTDVTRERAVELGDLSAYCDRLGNAHLYNKGTSPTREVDNHISILRPVFPNAERWVFTEAGYNNSPQDNLGKTIPESASAVYGPRAICDFLKRSAVFGRFELLDDPDPIDYRSQTTINRTADRQAHFGLVAMTADTVGAATPDTWRKKPEFYAVKNLLRLLSDRGSTFQPAALGLRISGGGADLQTLLLQKRDGRHYVCLWRDVQVSTFYPDAKPINVPLNNITVEIATQRPMAVYAPNRGDQPITTQPARSSITVPLAGELRVVEIG